MHGGCQYPKPTEKKKIRRTVTAEQSAAVTFLLLEPSLRKGGQGRVDLHITNVKDEVDLFLPFRPLFFSPYAGETISHFKLLFVK